MKSYYKKYIERTFYLAKKGEGKVSPNPLVGCVIVKNNKIIGEGYHEKYGSNHAEINAINSVKDISAINQSSIFINLEPCSHHGKTPPCVNELIKLKPKEVVISNKDPNPKVNGKGIKKIKEAGIKIILNVLKEKGEKLNRRFFCLIKNKRPYIILKWAQTKNNFIANKKNESKWISNNLSRQLVHKWRAHEDSILVGASTVEFDNPRLTVRKWIGKNPTRLVINPKNRLDNKKHIFNKSIKTINIQNINGGNLRKVISTLIKKKIGSIIIEGGSFTINKFIDNNLWDEMRIFCSKTTFKGGVYAPKFDNKTRNYKKILDDKLFILYNE